MGSRKDLDDNRDKEVNQVMNCKSSAGICGYFSRHTWLQSPVACWPLTSLAPVRVFGLLLRPLYFTLVSWIQALHAYLRIALHQLADLSLDDAGGSWGLNR